MGGFYCTTDGHCLNHCSGTHASGAGSDMGPALPDTSMKLGRYVHKHELFEIFS